MMRYQVDSGSGAQSIAGTIVLKRLADNLWVADQEFKLLSTNFGQRMTVINTGDGLMLVSPITMTKDLKKSVDAKGSVSFIVAPNPFHYLHVEEWLKAYPNAALIGSTALKKKRPSLEITQKFERGRTLDLPSTLEYVTFGSAKDKSELVIFHKPSSTLVLTDMLFNLKPKSFCDKLLFKPFGIKPYPCSSRLFKFLYKPNDVTRYQVGTMKKWPFERIIVAHGEIIEHDAKQAFDKAMAWQS